MVAANALYVAAEFATVSARKSRVQQAAETGNGAARRLLAILQDRTRLDNYVAGCQVGITVSSLVAGAYGQASLTPLLTPALGNVGGPAAAVVIILLAVTVLQVVLGELLPKTIALRYPERLSMATLMPMRISLLLFKPLILIFNGSAFTIMRALRLNTEQGHLHVHSAEELEGLYRESAAGGLIDADERDMLAGALGVDDKRVREIMTPRVRMVTISAQDDVTTAIGIGAASPYSRFPVSGANAEDIIGIVHLRSLFAAAQRDPATRVGAIMREPLIVAEFMSVPKLWSLLRTSGRRSAIVINEYGSVAGLVTLEDALEEIFGEVQDEFDNEEDLVVEHGATASVRGDVALATLADRYDIMLPDEMADTIGGLVWHMLGRLPQVDDMFGVPGTGLTLKVEQMDRHAVRRVLVIRDDAAPMEPQP
ncbi:hemolysin family protein [Sandarakinorhabdus sp.]|uniref:hemolysin family protein n=1 Tax=Sandarakinorhabdus sp. TaxID=1916663 RepID=UPI003F71E9CC